MAPGPHMPSPPHRPSPAPQPSVRGLATCLMALEQEAVALDQPLAARLIAAAAVALLEIAPVPGAGRDEARHPAG